MTKHILLAALLSPSGFSADPIRVLVWDEQQVAQKTAYGGKFLGETIAAHLGKLPGISVKNAVRWLAAPEKNSCALWIAGALLSILCAWCVPRILA